MTAIDFASFVDRLATVSGDTILPFFRTALAVENKQAGGFDPVTAADRAAEEAMRALIRESFPEHGILGEEQAPERTDAEYVWVLDPIDGTKSFIAEPHQADERAPGRHNAPAVHRQNARQ